MYYRSQLILLCTLALLWVVPDALAQPTPPAKSAPLGLDVKLGPDFKKLPTLVKSDTLTLQNEKRIFTYSGAVEMLHGDLRMSSDQLVGNYTEKNEIKDLTASGNVIILKGEEMRGTANTAIYDAAAGTLVLTDNPEMQQNGSVLTADRIIVYLNEDRSIAEGEVRVRLVKREAAK